MTIRTQDLTKTDFTTVLANPRKRLMIAHPGKFLETEFMVPHKFSANALANFLHVPANRITAILKGQHAITADTALRLARYLGPSAELWLNLQKDDELRTARVEIAAKIDALVEPMAA